MQLEAGSKLGHYEILSSLGAGGMGEVYRALDTKLGREVAIKLLLEGVSADPERLARFEREAKVLASLNHPNVATLYGYESEGDTGFLVMELVEGDTLADRIARGPLAPDEAVGLFVQIAEGLEAAHEKGVVHRDLKPANVKLGAAGSGVSPQPGHLKILDFGLAKAAQPEVSDAALSHSPTLTVGATRAGVLLGTAAYMSPEQAQGRPADQRADVWAFGCCLFEAVTGRRPFEGDNPSLVLAAVLKDDPPWETLRAGGGSPFEPLLRRCLSREPRERFHHAADLRIALRDVSADDAPVRAPSEPRRSRAWPGLVAAALALAVGYGVASVRDPELPARDSLTFEVALPAGMDFNQDMSHLALTPDGQELIFGATMNGERPRLHRREMSGVDIVPIEGTEGGSAPLVSPDGEWIAFWADGELRRVPRVGGDAVTLARLPRVRGGSWPVADELYVACEGGVYRVPAAGGDPEIVLDAAMVSEELGTYQLDGRGWVGAGGLLVTLSGDGGGVIGARPPSGPIRELTEGTGPWVSRDGGTIVFARGDQVMASAFDSKALSLGGELRLLAGDVQRTPWGIPQMAFDDRGTMAWIAAGSFASGEFVLVDREGRVIRELGQMPGLAELPRLSTDGSRLAVALQEARRTDYSVFVMDLDRGESRELSGAGWWWSPVWSRDDRTLYLSSERDGRFFLLALELDRTSEPTVLLELPASATDMTVNDVSFDGRWLLYRIRQPATDWDLWALSLETGENRQLVASELDEGYAKFSPDSKWIAYSAGRANANDGVFVRSFPEGDRELLVAAGAGGNPSWSSQGDRLFYRRGATVLEVDLDLAADGDVSIGAPKQLFSGLFRGRGDLFDVDPTSETFLLMRYTDAQRPRIRVARGLLPELAR
jgi:serine/threonine protein kinase/Tol biopolymer transport system component